MLPHYDKAPNRHGNEDDCDDDGEDLVGNVCCQLFGVVFALKPGGWSSTKVKVWQLVKEPSWYLHLGSFDKLKINNIIGAERGMLPKIS